MNLHRTTRGEKQHIGKKWTAILSFSALLSTSLLLPPTSALAASQDYISKKTLVLEGSNIVQAPALIHNGTTYMPVFYVDLVLKQLGISTKWNGKNWYISTPSWMPDNFSDIQVGSGNNGIYVNGVLVKRVNGIAAIDPSSNAPTVFVPIFYIQQLLNDLTVEYNQGQDWDGETWDMEPLNNTTSEQPAGIIQLVEDADVDIAATTNTAKDPLDDPAKIDHILFTAGYFTTHGYTQREAGDNALNWAVYSTTNKIKNMTLDDNTLSVTTLSSSSTQMVLRVSEWDIIDYTNKTTKASNVITDWTFDKDAGSGLWLIDNIVPDESAGTSTPAATASSTGSTSTSA